MRVVLVALSAVAVAACVTTHKPKERAIDKDIVVANAMCQPLSYGQYAYTKDKEGDRMVCGWEEFVGSHLPRCVCHDEKQLDVDRQMAQQYLRDTEMGRCVSQGSGDCRQ